MVPLLSLQQAGSDASEKDIKKCGNCQIQNNHSRQEAFLTLHTVCHLAEEFQIWGWRKVFP